MALFTGCASRFFYPGLISSAIRLLNYCGFEVLVPDKQSCNGTPAYSAGDFATARKALEKDPPNELARFFDYSISTTGLEVTVC